MSHRKSIEFAPEAYRAAELIAGGVPAHRLRARDIRRLSRGLVLHPEYEFDAFSYRARCIAVGMTLRPEHFLSRRSAATVFGIPCPLPARGRVDVGSFSPHRAPQHRIVAGHRVKSGVLNWQRTDGITIPSAADVWCQLAAVVSFPDLVAAGDSLLSGARVLGGGGDRTAPRCTPAELEFARLRHRNTLGAPQRKRAIALLRWPVDSPPETYVRLAIVDAGFDEPVVNCRVVTRLRVLHADLGYPLLRIAIEYEGGYHFASTEQLRWDAARRKQMTNAGWTVIIVMDDDLSDMTDMLATLAEAIESALARLNQATRTS